ncbi:unnamed protein product [Diamesa serratosioi]
MLGATEVPQDKIDAIHRGYNCLEKYLEQSIYLAADRMTLADLSVWAWMESITQIIPANLNEYPKINLWLNVLRKLPYYQEANKTGADLHIKLFQQAIKNNNLSSLNK